MTFQNGYFVTDIKIFRDLKKHKVDKEILSLYKQKNIYVYDYYTRALRLGSSLVFKLALRHCLRKHKNLDDEKMYLQKEKTLSTFNCFAFIIRYWMLSCVDASL